MRLRNVELYGQLTEHTPPGVLMTLVVRDDHPQENVPLRNLDAVQPPGSDEQDVFGDAIRKIGVLEREFALCDMSTFEDAYAAKAALDAALDGTTALRIDDWELPIAGVPGIIEWSHMLAGLKARIRFIPASAYWVNSSTSDEALGLL